MSGIESGTKATLHGVVAGRSVTKGAAGWRQDGAPVRDEVVAELVRSELAREVDGRLVLSEIGLGVIEAGDDGQAANRWLRRRGKVGRAALVENVAEAPLAWLMRRGMVTMRQFAAGDRLRTDYLIGQRPPSVTTRWDPATAAGCSGGSEAANPTAAYIEAKRRFEAALKVVGPGLSDVLTRVVCEGEGLAAAERACGWPVRAGKVVLQLALDRIADHYGM